MFRCCSRYCCCCSFFPSFHYLFAYWTLLIIILLFWYQATKMRETRRKPHKWNASLPVVVFVCVLVQVHVLETNEKKNSNQQPANKQTNSTTTCESRSRAHMNFNYFAGNREWMFGKNKNELHNRQILNEREKKKHIEHIEHTHTHTCISSHTTDDIPNSEREEKTTQR